MYHYVLTFASQAGRAAALNGLNWLRVKIYARRPDPENEDDQGELRPGWHALVIAESMPEELASYLAAEPWDIDPAPAGGLIREPASGPPRIAVTARQLRLALLQMQLLGAIDALVEADPVLGIWWRYSAVIWSDHPLVSQMMTALGKSQEEKDTLFAYAASL